MKVVYGIFIANPIDSFWLIGGLYAVIFFKKLRKNKSKEMYEEDKKKRTRKLNLNRFWLTKYTTI